MRQRANVLVTFFYRHLEQLIIDGRMYIAQPPLYRILTPREFLDLLDQEPHGGRVSSSP